MNHIIILKENRRHEKIPYCVLCEQREPDIEQECPGIPVEKQLKPLGVSIQENIKIEDHVK